MSERGGAPEDLLAVAPETGTGELRLDLSRRLVAEGLGTGLLVVAVVGSGIAASRLSAGDVGLQLLENSLATGAALVGLILAFGAVSGAHFNPVVTMVDRLLGTATTRDSLLYVVAQFVGGCAGAVVANIMFELPAVQLATAERSSPALWLSEIVATLGLLLVIQGCGRSGRSDVVAFAVAGWIVGASESWDHTEHYATLWEPNPDGTWIPRDLTDLIREPRHEIITTVIDKFEAAVAARGVCNENPNIFVLVDESHRTQYGSLHASMRKALPNACFSRNRCSPFWNTEAPSRSCSSRSTAGALL